MPENEESVSVNNIAKEIEAMFSYNSKLREKTPSEWIENYKKVYYYLKDLQAKGSLPSSDNYLNGNELATSIYTKKYYLKDLSGNPIENSPEEVFIRVASFVSAVEDDPETIAVEVYKQLYDGLWLPGGRVLAGAGDLYRLKTLANCFVTIIEKDNIESIYKAAYESARTYSYGGGMGIDISVLRPKGSVVHNAADNSTGAVSFMELYSLTTGLIGQSGRRGALMLTIDVKHPDVLDFIKVKSTPNWIVKQIIQQLKWSGNFNDEELASIEKTVMENIQVRFANISIKFNDEFFQALLEQDKYGEQSIVVYKKLNKELLKDAYQSEELHYSYGIPSKNIEDYELLQVFKNVEEFKRFVKETYKIEFDEAEFSKAHNRDVFGDYVIELRDYDYDLAVRFAGDFMLYFGSKQVGSIKRLIKARTLWNSFIEGNYKTAEPGLIFWSKMKKYSPSDYTGRPILGTNPCSEVPLEDGGACNLGSLNLARFVKDPFTDKASIDWDKLKQATHVLVRFLDNVVSWNIYLHPLEKQKVASKETRRVGLGVMGIADMFFQLGLDYDSEEAIALFESIISFIANEAYKASANLAEEKGSIPIFDYSSYSNNPFFKEALNEETKELVKNKGLRNVALLSIAPTGSISNVVKSFELNGNNYFGVSGGIEPLFAVYYTRRSESFGNKLFRLFHSTVKAYIDMKGLSEKVNELNSEQLKEILPSYFFKTAHKIDPLMRIKIQATAQKYVDHSISSTVNLPEDIHPEVISDIYVEAWKNGLKGITIYREGSRYPILSSDKQEKGFSKYKDKKFKIKFNGSEIIAKGSDILVLPNKKLTTVYHLMIEKDLL